MHSVGWSCGGKKLGSGSYDKTAVVYSLANDRLTKDHVLKVIILVYLVSFNFAFIL